MERANKAALGNKDLFAVTPGVWAGLVHVVRSSGVRGLFRGSLARVAFHVPNTAITFAAYEWCKGTVIAWQEGRKD